MLECSKLTKMFGGLTALKALDLTVQKGEILGLIGPNGSGKTTLFNVISGVYSPTSGSVKFKETEIGGMSSHRIAALGVGRTFQIVRPFSGLTVLDNVAVGELYGKSKTRNVADAQRKALEMVKFIGLSEKADAEAGSLTLAGKKRLEIGRALAMEPELALLDEVMAGLTPVEMEEAMRLVRDIRDKLGITVIMVEHVMKAVMGVSDRIVVLNFGEKIAEGTPQEVIADQAVVEAYLGKAYA